MPLPLLLTMVLLLSNCGATPSKLLWSSDFSSIESFQEFWHHHNQGQRFDATNVVDAVSVSGGKMRITTTAQSDGAVHTGMVSTKSKFEINSGFLEVRFRVDEIPKGMQCSLRLQSPLFGDVDIDPELKPENTGSVVTVFQLSSNTDNRISSSIATGNFSDKSERISAVTENSIKNGNFYVVGVELKKEKYAFYLNGEQYWETDIGMSGVPMYLVASCEVKSALGEFKSTTPHSIEFDYIRHHEDVQEYYIEPEGTLILKKDWSNLNSDNVSFANFTELDENYIPTQPNAKQTIRVSLREGAHLGTDSKFKFPDNTQDVWMSYCIRFSDNWRANIGGKLPGFSGNSSGKNGGQGGVASDGTNAWSARMVYGPYDAEAPGVPVGNYIYHAKQRNEKYGDTDWWIPVENKQFKNAVKLAADRWYKITQHIVMNSTDTANGVLEAYVDDQKVYSRRGLVFTNNDQFRNVDYFWLDVYHGGAEKAAFDQFVYFDQFNYSIGENTTTTFCN